MNTKSAIQIFNKLIEINNDRIEGYETASKETNEVDLKLLFSQFMQDSEKCKSELKEQVHKMNGLMMEGTKIAGKFFRVWMDVKTTLSGNDKVTLLDLCMYGEEFALEIYKNVLIDNAMDLSDELLSIIIEQQSVLQADYNRIKGMRDGLLVGS